MNKNKSIGFIIIGLVIAAGLFYGGLKYGEAHAQPVAGAFARGAGGAGANFAGRQTAGGGARAGANGGLVLGQILNKDSQSITIGLSGGGSKIVFLATSTPITKSVSGSRNDLQTGTTVSVIGSANSDGSVTAQSIQIRTATSTPR